MNFDEAYAYFSKEMGTSFEDNPVVAVALSGGTDSMLLMLLAQRWAKERGGRAIGLHVDHTLRKESTKQANELSKWGKSQDIEINVLTWTHPPISTGIQKKAREVRYALLEKYCRKQGILHLLVGHHKQDVSETFFMRVLRGTGAEGLYGMEKYIASSFIRIIRPMIHMPKLAIKSIPFWEDSSNANTAFFRVRVRQLLQKLSLQDNKGIETTLEKLKIRRRYDERQVWQHIAKYAEISPFGYACINKELWSEDGYMIKLVLRKIVHIVSGASYARDITIDFCSGPTTISGTRGIWIKNCLYIFSEYTRPQRRQRFWCRDATIYCDILGEKGFFQLPKAYRLSGSAFILKASMAMFDNRGKLIALPVAGYGPSLEAYFFPKSSHRNDY